MSAGTIFALSGNSIMMDYFSCLGPIDPQIEKDGKLVPALSYLNQFEQLNEKAKAGTLTSAEYSLLSKLDLGELYQFDQARELSCELLVTWLTKYKFKNWKKTETTKKPVTDDMKNQRAKKIADELSKTERWHTHGRGIDRGTLINEINLKIEDYNEMEDIGGLVREYFELSKDYMEIAHLVLFVHSRRYF